MHGVSIGLDADSLRPLLEAAAEAALRRVEADRERLPAKLCYSEEEAARLLGVGPKVLRDERLRGRISASRIVGRRIRYLHADLVAYLAGRRIGPTE